MISIAYLDPWRLVLDFIGLVAKFNPTLCQRQIIEFYVYYIVTYIDYKIFKCGPIHSPAAERR
jgi:hypothetical protein